MFGIANGPINAWHNANLDSARYSAEIEIADRTNWLLPAIGPRIGKLFNDVVVRPVSAVAGLVTRPDLKEPPAMPELPEAFQGNALGENLQKAYTQRTRAITASAESTKAYANLEFSKARQLAAVQAHEAALYGLALPESTVPNAPIAASAGTLVGGLVANIPPGTGGVRGALRSLMT